MSYKVEILDSESGEWISNHLRFPSYEEADQYAMDLARRWLRVVRYRAVETDDPPNSRYVVVSVKLSQTQSNIH